jgi:hypothetical protein
VVNEQARVAEVHEAEVLAMVREEARGRYQPAMVSAPIAPPAVVLVAAIVVEALKIGAVTPQLNPRHPHNQVQPEHQPS